jgi:hypothetical protein
MHSGILYTADRYENRKQPQVLHYSPTWVKVKYKIGEPLIFIKRWLKMYLQHTKIYHDFQNT